MQPEHAGDALKQRLSRRAAVLTIDVQRAFFATDGSWARLGYNTAPMEAVIPAIARLQALARKAGIAVVHVRTVGAPWLNWPRHVAPPDMIAHIERADDPPKYMLVDGTPDVEIAPECAPREEEPVITKHVFDAFAGTPLDFALRRLRAETLVLCGLTTDGCVSSTARSALGHGYAVIIASDATAAERPEHHQTELEILARLVGITATVDEIARAIAG